MSDPIIWHNPRCSKSRTGLALLQDLGHSPVVRLYLQDPPTLQELTAAHAALGLDIFAMLRSKDSAFKSTHLTRESPDDALFDLMVDNPKLIERPIVFWQDRAVIGRPTEAIAALFTP